MYLNFVEDLFYAFNSSNLKYLNNCNSLKLYSLTYDNEKYFHPRICRHRFQQINYPYKH